MVNLALLDNAEEQRVDEISLQKIKRNHETIQKLTSQLQEMQETDEFYE